jgi:excisionase family DNA binding protein
MFATPLLSEHDAAKRLNLSVKTLRRWRSEGSGLAFRKLGRAVRYSESDLAEFIAAAARRPADAPVSKAAA